MFWISSPLQLAPLPERGTNMQTSRLLFALHPNHKRLHQLLLLSFACLVSYLAHNRDADLNLCTETPNVYIIILYKLRSTTPLPPCSCYNCKAKGVCILTLAVWISALMPVKDGGRQRFRYILNLEMYCKNKQWIWKYILCVFKVYCIYVCILWKYAVQYLWRTVCMYICISILSAWCLMTVHFFLIV